MSLLEGECGEELRRKEERASRVLEPLLDHHIQILREENMVIIVSTNLVFFFAGNVLYSCLAIYYEFYG